MHLWYGLQNACLCHVCIHLLPLSVISCFAVLPLRSGGFLGRANAVNKPTSVPRSNPRASHHHDHCSCCRPPMGGGSFSGRADGASAFNTLVGRTIRVKGGQYNGYRGRVKHETGTHVQVRVCMCVCACVCVYVCVCRYACVCV